MVFAFATRRQVGSCIKHKQHSLPCRPALPVVPGALHGGASSLHVQDHLAACQVCPALCSELGCALPQASCTSAEYLRTWCLPNARLGPAPGCLQLYPRVCSWLPLHSVSSYSLCHLCTQKPQKLRHMLGQYGELGRVYLAPEGAQPPLSLSVCVRSPLKPTGSRSKAVTWTPSVSC